MKINDQLILSEWRVKRSSLWYRCDIKFEDAPEVCFGERYFQFQPGDLDFVVDLYNKIKSANGLSDNIQIYLFPESVNTLEKKKQFIDNLILRAMRLKSFL